MSKENENDDTTNRSNSQYSIFTKLSKQRASEGKFNTRTLLRPQIKINKNAFRRIMAGVYNFFFNVLNIKRKQMSASVVARFLSCLVPRAEYLKRK